MLTMRTAAALLTRARGAAPLLELLRAAGVARDSVVLDERERETLGLIDLAAPCLASSLGSVRVLVAESASDTTLRDQVQRIAHTLAARAPNVLWLAAVAQRDGESAALAGWSRDGLRGRIRIASFTWEPARVVDSDAETLCALSALAAENDVLLHARTLEILGREALTRRFYRALRAQVDALGESLPRGVDRADARHIALLYTSRLLFLCFLEAKGWLNGERSFVAARFDDCMRRGGQFHRRVLLPLFFGTLNTPVSRRSRLARGFGDVPFLNGGLFSRTPLERRLGDARFPDERLGGMLEELFLRFRFVAREDSASWSEASVDPEMLGRSFESLMAPADRRASGVYYTPHALVAHVADEALGGITTGAAARATRILDPACGSGAFLVYALERLASIRRDDGERADLAGIRRDVLAKSIFGVDLNPTAVWLCELRLWLSVVIESDERDVHRVPPLPNLDRNIRVGDALTGPAFAADPVLLAGSARALDLRQWYMRATGRRKQSLARSLDREERRRVVAQLDRTIAGLRHARSELLTAMRSPDLFGERRRTRDSTRALRQLRDDSRRMRAERQRVADGGALPFSFGAAFADVQARSGFDVVLGNPPWVRLHRIPAHLRLQLKRLYTVYGSAPWEHGAARARAAPGFASQVDLAALFVERSLALLKPGGTLSLLVPAKLWRALAGGGVRCLLLERAGVRRIDDWSESRSAFDAAVYPSLIVARKDAEASSNVAICVHADRGRTEWTIDAPHRLSFDDTRGAPWILLAPDARRAFDRVRAAGMPLAGTPFGSPRLGVKCGCNAAFLVRVMGGAHGDAIIVDANGRAGPIETCLLRPALRGDAVVPWQREPCDQSIIWTHDETGAPLRRLPPHASAWLRRHYSDLTQRSDARNGRRWWSLFRVDAADSRAARVVWSDFGRRPRALVLPPGDPTVPLNTCYVISCAPDDAVALCALLNAPLVAAWLNALAEPARGGYRRYLGWTVGLLPIPRDWSRARPVLAAAARSGDDALDEAALAAYALDRRVARALQSGTV